MRIIDSRTRTGQLTLFYDIGEDDEGAHHVIAKEAVIRWDSSVIPGFGGLHLKKSTIEIVLNEGTSQQ